MKFEPEKTTGIIVICGILTSFLIPSLIYAYDKETTIAVPLFFGMLFGVVGVVFTIIIKYRKPFKQRSENKE